MPAAASPSTRTTGVVTVAGHRPGGRRDPGDHRPRHLRDGSIATQSYTITVNDADEFDVTPVSDTNAAANAVTENATIGTTVGITAFASDGDATNSGVTYSLTDDAGGRFAINSTTGVVTVPAPSTGRPADPGDHRPRHLRRRLDRHPELHHHRQRRRRVRRHGPDGYG